MHPKLFSLKNLRIIFILILLAIVVTGCKTEANNEGITAIVHIEKDEQGFHLVRNGKPFNIRGAAAHPDYLEELKKSGANTVRIYDIKELLNTLNKADSLGLAVVIDIPLPSYNNAPEFYEDPVLFKKMRREIQTLVKTYKDHPALLYWNLGNEIKFPPFYKNIDFFKNYKTLVNDLHVIDKNHPVSTTIAGASRKRLRSIILRGTNLDFYSFNIFGGVSTFPDQLGINRYLWDGEYVISEWGINGPWENGFTTWKAPIEETSTKKAEQIKERYQQYIQPLEAENSLGNFVFYWGNKNEVTPTWFSLFGEKGEKTQAVFELTKIWKNHNLSYPGPKVDYMLLNGKGALESVILLPDTTAVAEVILPGVTPHDLQFRWELRKESWFLEDESASLKDFQHSGTKKIKFETPGEEGPYRLYLYLSNGSEYIATANLPFYVLKQNNGE